MTAKKKGSTLTQRQIEIWLLLLALALGLPSLSFPSVSEARKAKAVATYERALRMRATLESQAEGSRRKADYLKLIRTFKEVYHLNPASAKSPVALINVGDIYEEMGRQFHEAGFYREAIKAYEFVAREYPYSRPARDALFTIGEVYRTDLEDLAEAHKAYLKFLKEFPQSARSAEARAKLREVDEALSARVTKRAPPQEILLQEKRSERVPEVTAIRNWVGPNYSRVVIGVEGEAKFETQRLSNPDRIVLDLPGTRLSPALAGKTFPVQDGFLRQVRVAQFRAGVTRVVLDVDKIEDYSIFSLPNPFRLVIDIHGTPTVTAEAPATKPGGIREGPVEKPASVRAANKPSADITGQPELAAEEANPKKGTPTTEGPGRKSMASRRAGESSDQEPQELAKLKAPAGPGNPGMEASLGPARTGTDAKSKGSSTALPPARPDTRTLTRTLGLKIGRIVIDPGHGGHDTGTIGPTGLREKDLVLDVALRLKRLVEEDAGAEVVMTRDTDTFVPLEERTAIANQKAADLFISIHANASRDKSARGIETYYLNFTSNPEALEVAARENATSQESVHQLQDLVKKIVLTEKIEESHAFARDVQKAVHTRLVKASGGQKDRGVKKAPFVVLIGANMPSILAEISFLTNPRDERNLKKPDYRQKIAEALYEGMMRYMSTLGGVKVAQKNSAEGPARPSSDQQSRAVEGANF
jgi:N-acetylmuramoyl-L-alanine amidase